MPKVLTRAEKISRTMRLKKLDNFSAWRQQQILDGKGPVYLEIKRDGDLAELMGVVLGDGHIWQYPRTQELSIFSNSNNPGFIQRYSELIEKLFGKKPVIRDHHGLGNCTRIRIYQKNIAKRIGVPISPHRNKTIVIPSWIFRNKGYIVRYLRGLYEAEGSFSVHLPTSTYKAFFSNRNISMLENVFNLLVKLGFHPHMSPVMVQLSRKAEVQKFRDLIEFRKY